MDIGLLDAASAARPADLAVRGGRLVNVFTEEIYPADVAVAGQRIVAVGAGVDEQHPPPGPPPRSRGQVVVGGDGEVLGWLALPVGGIVADLPPQDMAAAEARLDAAAARLGCTFASPFMYMIFLSVTAIPDYAMTDLGLIDCVNLSVMSPVLGPAGPARGGRRGGRPGTPARRHEGNRNQEERR